MMRRLPRAALALWLWAAGAALAAEYAPVKNMPVPIRVGAHGYYVQGQGGPATAANEGYNSNAGFVVTPDGVVVIDALGTPGLGQALIEAIRRVTDRPIKRVVVTHYHADHVYGLQAFKAAGADIWAHRGGRAYLEGEAEARLEQRRRDLAPWVDADTRVVPADRWLDGNATFTLGGLTFDLIHLGPAHSPEDLVVVIREEQLVFSGDLIFTGRIPFVGEADSKRWLATMDRLLALKPTVMVPGHGKVSTDPASDLALTRDYLLYLRATMGKAVEDFVPFDEAYRNTDWGRFSQVPAFDAANRINAYGTYLLMERESLQR
jgi:glyoxylase-like metal-dependent hydrolase (beta-lactamase superfamily II)